MNGGGVLEMNEYTHGNKVRAAAIKRRGVCCVGMNQNGSDWEVIN